MADSWLFSNIYVAGQSGSGAPPPANRFPFYDGRFPVKRTVGWAYIVGLLGVKTPPTTSNPNGSPKVSDWAYVVLGGTRQSPEAWVYFAPSDSFGATEASTGSPTSVSGWLWFTASITNNYDFTNTAPGSSTQVEYFWDNANSRWCYLN